MAYDSRSPALRSPLVEGRRVFVFSGHAGAGKTEIAINFALGLSREAPTCIADFDIINPYFRTADARSALEAAGVRLVAPQYAGTNVDVPALPGEMRRLFDDEGVRAVFDVGGDDLGAKAVSCYRDDFLSAGALHIFVFNARRPMSSTVEKAELAFGEIQASARVPFGAIANNTHLLGSTSPADLMEGLDAALELAGRVGMPIAFNALMAPGGAGQPAAAGPAAAGLGEGAQPAAAGHAAAGLGEGAQPDADAASALAPFLARSSALGIPILWLDKHITMEYQSGLRSPLSPQPNGMRK